MTALFGQICTERRPAILARPDKPMYQTIQGEGHHPEERVKKKITKA